MNKRMECSVTDGPASTDDYNDENRHPEEREFDKYLDTDPEDYADLRAADLNAALIGIARESSRIGSLTERLLKSLWARRQGE